MQKNFYCNICDYVQMTQEKMLQKTNEIKNIYEQYENYKESEKYNYDSGNDYTFKYIYISKYSHSDDQLRDNIGKAIKKYMGYATILWNEANDFYGIIDPRMRFVEDENDEDNVIEKPNMSSEDFNTQKNDLYIKINKIEAKMKIFKRHFDETIRISKKEECSSLCDFTDILDILKENNKSAEIDPKKLEKLKKRLNEDKNNLYSSLKMTKDEFKNYKENLLKLIEEYENIDKKIKPEIEKIKEEEETPKAVGTGGRKRRTRRRKHKTTKKSNRRKNKTTKKSNRRNRKRKTRRRRKR